MVFFRALRTRRSWQNFSGISMHNLLYAENSFRGLAKKRVFRRIYENPCIKWLLHVHMFLNERMHGIKEFKSH